MNILYDIFIYPLVIFFAFVLHVFRSHQVLGIVFLSMLVQILSEPLYRIAYKIEKKEKDLQKKITTELNVLKTLYIGETLFHRTDSLYKKYSYNPLLAFRASTSLFLVIPFFVAAYEVLNNNPIFVDSTFFGLFNLENPDQLFFGINILPILMTIFNLIAIKNANPQKHIFDSSNTMLLALSVFFLVYLYNSSSALLLYWTMNNFIYMIKLFLTRSKLK